MSDVLWAIQTRRFQEIKEKASEVPNDRKAEEVKGATAEATGDKTTPTMTTGNLSATTTTETAAHGVMPPATEITTATTETPEPREDF